MSFINHLIKRAKAAEQPCTLDVPTNRVGSVVEHIVGCQRLAYSRRDDVRQWLLDGKISMLGHKLRVMGTS